MLGGVPHPRQKPIREFGRMLLGWSSAKNKRREKKKFVHGPGRIVVWLEKRDTGASAWSAAGQASRPELKSSALCGARAASGRPMAAWERGSPWSVVPGCRRCRGRPVSGPPCPVCRAVGRAQVGPSGDSGWQYRGDLVLPCRNDPAYASKHAAAAAACDVTRPPVSVIAFFAHCRSAAAG